MTEEKRAGLSENINVDEDENGKWYWEDYNKDIYRKGFASRKAAIKDALQYDH